MLYLDTIISFGPTVSLLRSKVYRKAYHLSGSSPRYVPFLLFSLFFVFSCLISFDGRSVSFHRSAAPHCFFFTDFTPCFFLCRSTFFFLAATSPLSGQSPFSQHEKIKVVRECSERSAKSLQIWSSSVLSNCPEKHIQKEPRQQKEKTGKTRPKSTKLQDLKTGTTVEKQKRKQEKLQSTSETKKFCLRRSAGTNACKLQWNATMGRRTSSDVEHHKNACREGVWPL